MENFYKKTKKVKTHNPNFKKHNIEINFRMCIIGGSGSGKTNTLLNLIKTMNNTFEHIHLCVKSKEEPLYDYLFELLNPAGQITIYEEGECPVLTDLPNRQSLIVFDDLILNKQNKIADYYIRGRKKGLSMVYLSQSYYGMPKIIRNQCNYIILKKLQSLKDLNLILSEFSLGVSKEHLQNLYKKAIEGDFLDFFLIDLQTNNDELKFRKNFKSICI